MTSNLWNVQSPTKRIDLYFKIDDYKKHLLHLKNVKSTFKKNSSENLFRTFNLEQSHHINLKQKKNAAHIIRHNLQSQASNIQRQQQSPYSQSPYLCSQRPITCSHQQKMKFQLISDHKQSLKLSKVSSNCFSPTSSPNKYQKFRQRQINQQNRKILDKIQNAKASKQLTKKHLFHKYSESDMKYRINLQKTKYLNVDFTKQAEKLLKGEKIKFSKIKIANDRINDNWKMYRGNLDWKLTKKTLSTPRDNLTVLSQLR